MSLLTSFLKLFKYDPVNDKESTFNITKALNENWDKIDAKVEEIENNKVDKVDLESQALGKGASKIGIHDAGNKFTATNVEGALEELFQYANDGKLVVANAVTAKGIAASPSDTFPTLANKIGLIETDKTGDATATAADILLNKSAYAKGAKLIGTLALTGTAVDANVLAGTTYYNTDAKVKRNGGMPNRAGDNNALAISRSGTTLKFRAPTGFFDGIDDTVQYTSADWFAENILEGKNIFNVIGTCKPEKKWASGTVTLTEGQRLTATGLKFQPSRIIIAKPSSIGVHSVYDKSVSINKYAAPSETNVNIGGNTGDYINSTGFSLAIYTVYTGSNVIWWAEE